MSIVFSGWQSVALWSNTAYLRGWPVGKSTGVQEKTLYFRELLIRIEHPAPVRSQEFLCDSLAVDVIPVVIMVESRGYE